MPAAPRPAVLHALLGSFTFLWGANFVLAAMALTELSPLVFSVSRFAAAALVLVPVAWWRPRGDGAPPPRAPAKRDLPRLLVVALLGAVLAPWLGIEGLALTGPGRAALYPAMAPAISVLVGRAMGHERLSRGNLVGIALVAVGSLALGADRLRAGGAWLGDVLLALAVLAAVAELHLIERLAARYGAGAATAWRTGLGTVLYALIASPALVAAPWIELGAWTWVAILAGGVLGVGLGSWVKVAASRVLGPTRVIVYGNLVPLTTWLLGALFVGDVPRLGEALASVLVVLGAFFVQRRGAREHTAPRPVAARAKPTKDTDA